jgi:hypothetical protein
MTKRTGKNTNIEGKFFAIIALAWVILAIVFNIARHVLPQAKTPMGGVTAAAQVSYPGGGGHDAGFAASR